MRQSFDIFRNLLLSAAFWAILAACVLAIVWHADFVFGDEQMEIGTIGMGKFCPPSVARCSGRCFPLCHFDCNLIFLLPRWFRAHMAATFYAANAVIFVVTAWVFAAFATRATECRNTWMERVCPFLVTVSLLAAPSVMMMSCLNIYAEHRLMLLLAVFVSSAYLALRHDSHGGCLCAFVSALLALGYKETSFVLVGVFAASILLGGWKRVTPRGRRFCLSLIALCALYVLAYGVIIAPYVRESYSDVHAQGRLAAFAYYFLKPEMGLALIATLVRLSFFLSGKSGEHLFWDALLFAGTAFVAAYAVLGMIGAHYPVPAFVFVFAALAHGLATLVRASKPLGFVAIAALLVLMAFNTHSAIKKVTAHLQRRETEMPLVRALAGNASIRTIYYYAPPHVRFGQWYFDIITKCLAYSGCQASFEPVPEVRTNLKSDEAEVIVTHQGLGGNLSHETTAFLQRNMVDTKWFGFICGHENR